MRRGRATGLRRSHPIPWSSRWPRLRDGRDRGREPRCCAPAASTRSSTVSSAALRGARSPTRAGMPYAMALANGTVALELALRALGRRPGRRGGRHPAQLRRLGGCVGRVRRRPGVRRRRSGQPEHHRRHDRGACSRRGPGRSSPSISPAGRATWTRSSARARRMISW